MVELINLLNTAGAAFVAWAGRMLIQSSVLIVVLAVLDLALRRRVKAVVRYWIWLLVLAKLVLPPSFSSPTGLAYWVGGGLPVSPARVAPVAPAPPAPARPAGEPVASSAPRVLDAGPSAGPTFEEPPIAHAESAHSVSPAAPRIVPITWQALVLPAWALVVVVMAVLLIQRALLVRGLVAQSREAPAEIAELLRHCGGRMGVRMNPAVRLSPLSASPSVCGLWRPVILIPEEILARLHGNELKAVLFHELAHVKRGDLWLNLVQTLLQIVYFYHPLLWVANARIRRVREQAVDETVLAALGAEAEDYPRMLLSVSRLAFGRPALSLRLLGVVESKKALADRIRYMVSRPFPQNARLGLRGLTAIVVAALVLLPMARGSERDVREAVCDFAADRELPVGLVVGTRVHPRLAEVTWVRLDQTYDTGGWDLTARVGWSPAAEASWRLQVELLDDQGHVLPHAQDEPTIFTGRADTPGRSGMHYAELNLGPLRPEGRRRPAKVRVGLEPTQDPASAPAAETSGNREIVIAAVDGNSQKPIPGAAVIAKMFYMNDRDAAPVLLQSTDARGEGRIVCAKSGLVALDVMVEKNGYATAQEHWSNGFSRGVSQVSPLEVPPQRMMELVATQPIGGLVQDREGAAIAGAQVTIRAYSQRTNGMVSVTRAVQTDTEGRWTVEGIPSDIDSVSLEFKHPGYVAERSGPARISGDQLAAAKALTYVVHMDKGLPVSGRVLDDQGRPVAHAAVLLGPAYAGRFCYGHADTRTDASGVFRFDNARDNRKDTGFRAGSTGMLVEVAGYVPAFQRVVVEPNLAPLEFHLSHGRTVNILVVDPNQRPLAGAWTVMYPLAEEPRYNLRQPDTDEQGRVRILNVPQSDIRLDIYRSGYLNVRDYTVGAAENEVVVTLTPAPRVQGTVCDAETGRPIPNFEVQADVPGARGPTNGVPLRFTEGRFDLLLGSATAQTGRLTITAAGYEPTTSEPIPLQGTRVVEIKMARDRSFNSPARQPERGGPLGAPGEVRGIVQDPNGLPVANATVISHDLQAAGTTTDAQGRFRMRAMSMRRSPFGGGAYILVRQQQHNLAAAVEVNETQAGPLVVTLVPGLTLAGQVVNAQGQGVPNAEVSLILWPPQATARQIGSSLPEPTRCDPNGYYEIRAVPPGQRYSVHAGAEGYGSDQVQLDTAAAVGRRMELKPLVLQTANLSVSGVVVDAQGKPVANVQIRCLGPGQPQLGRPVQTDAQGCFTVGGLAAGIVYLQANTQGEPLLVGRARVQAGTTNVTIVVRPAVSTPGPPPIAVPRSP